MRSTALWIACAYDPPFTDAVVNHAVLYLRRYNIHHRNYLHYQTTYNTAAGLVLRRAIFCALSVCIFRRIKEPEAVEMQRILRTRATRSRRKRRAEKTQKIA
jgi:hypothetical protein